MNSRCQAFRRRKWLQGLVVLPLTGLLIRCTGPAGPDAGKATNDSIHTTKLDNRKKPGSGFSDTLVIHGSAAVFFQPDSLQLERIKTVNEKRIYESLMHDCYYQMRNARLVMERSWPGIQRVDATRARWLAFVHPDNSITMVDLDAVNDICGIYLFNGVKRPERIDMMNIDTELDFYFRK